MHNWVIWICLVPAMASAGTAYRWVDENDRVNYSDRPAPGAQRIELIAATPAARAVPASTPVTRSQPVPDGPGAAVYESFRVVQPARQQVFWGTGGRVDVGLLLAPELQPGHRLGVYLDGELAVLDGRGTRFQLHDVHRGEHTLQVVILDARQNEILRSPAVTFFVQQTSIHYPRNQAGNRSGG